MRIGKEQMSTNADMFIEIMPIVSPIVRTLVGKTSTVQIDPNGTIPTDEMKTTNDMLMTGTHVNADKSYANESQYKYVAIVKIPMAEPANDTIKSNFLPCVSMNLVAINVPAICMTARTMDDVFADRLEPDSANMVDA